MLATSGPFPPDDGRWAYEVKWDGWRALVTVDDKVTVHTLLWSAFGPRTTGNQRKLTTTDGNSKDLLGTPFGAKPQVGEVRPRVRHQLPRTGPRRFPSGSTCGRSESWGRSPPERPPARIAVKRLRRSRVDDNGGRPLLHPAAALARR